LLLWLFPKGIIDKSLPIINKYCNFTNIETIDFQNCDKKQIKLITDFIKTYYISSNSYSYMPSIENFSSYFNSSIHKTFISMYYKTIKTNNYHKELIAVITSRPINIILKNNCSFLAYYVDNLCVHKSYRKQNIAPQLIQTTHFVQRHSNNNSSVSLFKQEGYITNIVSLTKYNTYQFFISSILNINNNNNNNINNNFRIVRVNKSSLTLLYDFIKSYNSFNCIILPDINVFYNLIQSNTYIVYIVMDNYNYKAVYFFKDSQMSYNLDTTRDINNNDHHKSIHKIKSIDCFASINLFNDYNNFIHYFNQSLSNINNDNNYHLITIENISNNNIIINNLFSLNKIPRIVSPTAYFYYNYAKKPILPDTALIIC